MCKGAPLQSCQEDVLNERDGALAPCRPFWVSQEPALCQQFQGPFRPLNPTTHQESAFRPGPFATKPEKPPAILQIITPNRRTINSESKPKGYRLSRGRW